MEIIETDLITQAAHDYVFTYSNCHQARSRLKECEEQLARLQKEYDEALEKAVNAKVRLFEVTKGFCS